MNIFVYFPIIFDE